MRRIAGIVILVLFFLLVSGKDLSALTFEFDKDKPGVQTFALKYLRFTVGGENIIPKLPATFYLISYFYDDIPVLAAKAGKIDKTSGLTPYLKKLSGGDNAKSVTGTHGEKIIYNPDRPPDKKMLSSYALWDGWIFIGNKKETLNNLLKLYKSPSDILNSDKSLSSIKEWKVAGIKLWGDNSNDNLFNLFEEQKKRVLVPFIKDPKKIKYITGAFVLADSKEMSGTLIISPASQQASKDIEGDLKFIEETIRRRLMAIKVLYKGKVSISDNNIVFETSIGNYIAAQGQIMEADK